MSAQNLLETIPHEIGIVGNADIDYKAFVVLAIFKSMLLKITKKVRIEDTNIKSMESSNYKGWLYQMYLRKENNLCCFLDYGINQEQKNNFMYLFSHGGLPHKILDKPELFANILNYLDISPELSNLLTNAREYYNVAVPKGGFYKKTSDTKKLISRDKIISSVSILNEIVKENINIVLGNEDVSSEIIDSSEDDSDSSLSSVESDSVDETKTSSDSTQTSASTQLEPCEGKSRKLCPENCKWFENKCQQRGGASKEEPNKNMLFLLIISSGFNLTNFVNKITDVKLKETILSTIIGDKERQSVENLDILFPSSEQITPLSTGFKTMRNDTPFLDQSHVQLVQFIGHSPNGFGATIDKCDCQLEDGSNSVTFIINLDSSNTFYGSNLNKLDDRIKSKSYCKFKDNNHVKINTTLVLNIGEDNKKSLVHEKFSDKHSVGSYKKGDSHKYITDSDLTALPILEFTSVLGSDLLNEQIEYSGENNINVHGFTNIMEQERIVFSVNEAPNSFNKNLYCLNLENYQIFLGIIKKEEPE